MTLLLVALASVAAGCGNSSSSRSSSSAGSSGSPRAHATVTTSSTPTLGKPPAIKAVRRRRHARQASSRRERPRYPVLGVRLALIASPSFAPGTSGPVSCDLVASPLGSDGSGNGSPQHPFASVGKLDASLAPGQTGCLRAGTYGNTSSWHRIDKDGMSSARITITSYPGETATVLGYVDVEASYTTLSHLRIDGSNTLYASHPGGVDCPAHVSEPLVIAGHDDVLEYDDYFQSIPSLRGNGIGVGFWGDADNTIIRFNKIHDVGQCIAYDHLIYVSHGNDVRIYGNWIWGDRHGHGVQLYPAPTNAEIFDNVIDHAGVGFGVGDEPGETASDDHIFDNIVINSTGLPGEKLAGSAMNIGWGGTPGTGNTFTGNDSFNNDGGIGNIPDVAASANSTADPHLLDPAHHDYRIAPGN